MRTGPQPQLPLGINADAIIPFDIQPRTNISAVFIVDFSRIAPTGSGKFRNTVLDAHPAITSRCEKFAGYREVLGRDVVGCEDLRFQTVRRNCPGFDVPAADAGGAIGEVPKLHITFQGDFISLEGDLRFQAGDCKPKRCKCALLPAHLRLDAAGGLGEGGNVPFCVFYLSCEACGCLPQD